LPKALDRVNDLSLNYKLRDEFTFI